MSHFIKPSKTLGAALLPSLTLNTKSFSAQIRKRLSCADSGTEKTKADLQMFVFPFECPHCSLLSTPENNSNCRQQGRNTVPIVMSLKMQILSGLFQIIE